MSVEFLWTSGRAAAYVRCTLLLPQQEQVLLGYEHVLQRGSIAALLNAE
jgi:hypothetical protein